MMYINDIDVVYKTSNNSKDTKLGKAVLFEEDSRSLQHDLSRWMVRLAENAL